MSETHAEHLVVVKQMHRWKLAFFGLVTLLAGMIIGAGLTLITLHHFRQNPAKGIEFINRRVVEHMQRELDLSPEQRAQIEALFDRHFSALHQIREEARPQIARELNQLHENVMAVLNDEQQAKWQTQVEHLRERFGPPSDRDLANHRRDRGRGRGREHDDRPGPFHFWETPPKAPAPPPPPDEPENADSPPQ